MGERLHLSVVEHAVGVPFSDACEYEFFLVSVVDDGETLRESVFWIEYLEGKEVPFEVEVFEGGSVSRSLGHVGPVRRRSCPCKRNEFVPPANTPKQRSRPFFRRLRWDRRVGVRGAANLGLH